MKREHYEAIQALTNIGVYFAPWEGQFIHGLKKFSPDAELSEKQIEQLERIAIKFRRILSRRGYPVPNEILAPYHERKRQQKTPDEIKYHWVKP